MGLERMETHLHVRRGDDGILIEIVIAIAIVIVSTYASTREGRETEVCQKLGGRQGGRE